MSFFKSNHPFGIGICIFVGILGIALSKVTPLDAVTLSIVCGALIGNLAPVPVEWKSGIVWSEKKLLGIAIALYGLKLNFAQLQELGLKSFGMVLLAIGITLLLSKPIGTLFKLERRLGLAVGIGTAICGSAAIAATKDIIEADETQAGLAVAVINFIGTLGIFLLPILGIQVLHLDTIDHGFMLGNSLQAVGQVVAAGFSVDEATGQIAVIVKMGRVLMLTPLIFILMRVFQQKNAENKGKAVPIPNFVLGFIFCSILATFQVLPETVNTPLTEIGKIFLIISMGGIGLKISFSKIREFGLSAMGMALVLFLIQLGLSIAMIMVF